jgi:hypothetical protein
VFLRAALGGPVFRASKEAVRYFQSVRRFLFWQRWLFLALVVQGFVGLILAFFGPSVLLGPFNHYYDQTTFGQSEVPEIAQTFHRWIYSVLGATMASWAVALAYISQVAFKRRERWAWNCIALSLITWFPVDTFFSWKLGVWPNVIFNLTAFAMIAIPLAFSRPAFYSAP